MSEFKNGKTVKASQVVMTELVLPSHTNALDSIFGGVIMSWMDICAAITAQRHASCDVVTASLDQLSFIAPVYKGFVVNLKSSVNFVAKTSMEVGVRIDAENPRTGERFHTASAYLTFVAVDQNGRPVEVPPLILETAEERERHEQGAERRAHRMATRQLNKQRKQK